MSPDGMWWWDGHAWSPARKPSRSTGRVVALIAGAAVVVLLVAGVGAFAISRVFSFEQSGLASLTLACKGPADPAGAPVGSGDTVCGYKLGTPQITASCVGATTIPDGLRAWKREAGASEQTTTDLLIDAQGCALDAPAGGAIGLVTTSQEPPDIVAVVDYTPENDWGLIAFELGCNDATCLLLLIDPAGVYRVDEERGHGNWTNVSKGALPLLTISRLGQLNRVVLRYRDGGVQAFLNGYLLARTRTYEPQSFGVFGVYLENRIGSEPAAVHVRTLDAFASV